MKSDLAPAAERMARVVTRLSDDQLDLPTPCPSYTVRDLLAHVGGLSLAFTAAAKKERGALVELAPGDGDLPPLPGDWRTRIPNDLATLADAWSNDDAWTGMTRIAGGDTPGKVAGLVVLDELVVHGWDIATATGQEYESDRSSLDGALEVLGLFQTPGVEVDPGSAFGTVVELPEDAALLDRVLGLSGRDPSWSPA